MFKLGTTKDVEGKYEDKFMCNLVPISKNKKVSRIK